MIDEPESTEEERIIQYYNNNCKPAKGRAPHWHELNDQHKAQWTRYYMRDNPKVMGVRVDKRYIEQPDFQEEPTNREIFAEDLKSILEALEEMLLYKNEKYGDSALNPTQIFSSCNPIELLNVRIDDKLARIKNTKDDDEDPEWDLMGYLTLKRIAIKREQQKLANEQVN